MENSKNEEIFLDLKVLLTLFCFQEEIYQKISSKNGKSKDIKYEGELVYAIEKNIMTKYKNFYYYEILYNFLIYNKSILNCIKDNNIIDTEKLKSKKILNEIISQLPNYFINKINNIDKNNKNKLIEEIENENKKEWNYKMIKYEDNKLRLKFINDFEIINEELFIFLDGQGIKLNQSFEGKYIIEYRKIFIILKGLGEIFYEIGKNENKENNDKNSEL